jgi:OmpA-OmpF porin, OOP family
MRTNTNTYTIKQLALACALALGVVSGTAGAQAGTSVSEQALVTTTPGQVWMNSFGDCWHSAYGPAPLPNVLCGPQPVAKYVAPYVELYVAPAASVPVAPIAPVAVAAAAPLVVWEKVSFEANVLFDSDKSALRQAGRDTLDQFATNIRGLEAHSIVAIGYADRMGTQASNQVLSQQRVDAVKTYLVGKGIASNRVETSARGETRPTTYGAECKDANNAKNVACMQPDRHVFIEVSGSRVAE